MPRRYKKKTPYTRRKRGAVVRYQRSRISTPFPRVFKTKLRYVTQDALDPVAFGFSTRLFTATSPFDPETAVGGHQPRYFDQIMPMYDHYVVLGSKITIQCSSTDNTNTALMALGIHDGNIAFTNVNDYLEYKHGRYKVITTNTSGKQTTLVSKYSPKFLGKNNPINEDELKGTSTTDPAENAFFHLMIAPLDPAINIGRINFLVSIEYLVAFIEPKNPAQS